VFDIFDITCGEQGADRRRRNRGSLASQQLDGIDLKTVPNSLVPEDRDIPFPIPAEPKIRADDHELRSERAQQHLVYEFCGMHRSDLLEREDPNEVDPERLENLEALLDRRQQPGDSLRSYQRQGMAIEGQHRPLSNSQRCGPYGQIRQHGLVAPVNSVVHADGHGRSLRR
jgi:hypothetical protein